MWNDYRTRKEGEGKDGRSVRKHQIEEEFNLPECPDLFEEYLEMGKGHTHTHTPTNTHSKTHTHTHTQPLTLLISKLFVFIRIEILIVRGYVLDVICQSF